MLRVEDARVIAAEWRPKFIDEAAFDVSWSRYFDMTGNPTETTLIAWLRQDQAKDEVKQAGLAHEPLLPVRQDYVLSDCRHCGGNRYVRDELPVEANGFGMARKCPACGDPQHRQTCYACAHFLGGYFGPETPTVETE